MVWGSFIGFVQLVVMVLGLMLCVTSFMDGGVQIYQCN